jgi:hypothetical protein
MKYRGMVQNLFAVKKGLGCFIVEDARNFSSLLRPRQISIQYRGAFYHMRVRKDLKESMFLRPTLADSRF